MTEIFMYDSDWRKVTEVEERLNKKYSGKPNTAANLESFASEAVDLFRKAGFEVSVAIPLPESGESVPEINIISKLEDEFDPEKMQYEVKKDG